MVLSSQTHIHEKRYSNKNVWYSRFDDDDNKMSNMSWALYGQRIVPRGEHDKVAVFLMQEKKFPPVDILFMIWSILYPVISLAVSYPLESCYEAILALSTISFGLLAMVDRMDFRNDAYYKVRTLFPVSKIPSRITPLIQGC